MPCTGVQECCWGNHFDTDPRPVLPVDEWVCMEMTMRLNSVNQVQSDGEMSYWINDVLGHRETGMHWRDILAELEERFPHANIIVENRAIGAPGSKLGPEPTGTAISRSSRER